MCAWKGATFKGCARTWWGFTFMIFEDLVMSGSTKRCDPTFLARKLTIIQWRDSATISPLILEHRLKNTVQFWILKTGSQRGPTSQMWCPQSTFLQRMSINHWNISLKQNHTCFVKRFHERVSSISFINNFTFQLLVTNRGYLVTYQKDIWSCILMITKFWWIYRLKTGSAVVSNQFKFFWRRPLCINFSFSKDISQSNASKIT